VIGKETGNQSVYCNLVIGEMCIRQQVGIDSEKNVHGYINMGAEHSYDSDDIPLAKNVLVVLAVGINSYWKMPLTYFHIDGLGGKERANLLQEAINLMHDTGAKLQSIIIDGANVNTRMCTELGANFDHKNPQAFIISKYDEKLFIYLDPAYMLELIRNA